MNTTPLPAPHRQLGVSLLELVVFMVVLSVALAGVLGIFIQATRASADPQQQRQSLAIAESLLAEVELMPFTWCDPDDANVETAASAAGCATQAEAMGPESGETRHATPQFDNVNDYHGYSMAGIVDIAQQAVAGLSGYSASVAVTAGTLGNGFLSITAASAHALRITVTVTSPNGQTLSLDGYRTLHAPNAAF